MLVQDMSLVAEDTSLEDDILNILCPQKRREEASDKKHTETNESK